MSSRGLACRAGRRITFGERNKPTLGRWRLECTEILALYLTFTKSRPGLRDVSYHRLVHCPSLGIHSQRIYRPRGG
jgi:hypothetical protein